ncbi:MAG: endolytic transglycosylase MltG [Bacilli bacterium]|nr:endolytic transglycosylase MltG [Bacilli bacterium]
MKLRKPIKIIMILTILLVATGVFYAYLISPVDKNDNTAIKVKVQRGASVKQIAKTLKQDDLIRSETLFLIEMKLNHHKSLKAATYTFDKTMNLNEIITKLENATSMGEVQITFNEGERITTYAKQIADKTDNSYDYVLNSMKDRVFCGQFVNKYWFLTNDILNQNIYYPLEGYLAPDTYDFTNEQVDLTTIIETMLDQEEKVLEPYKSKIAKNPHHYITMASIAEIEGTNKTNKKMIVGIFNNRLQANMNLGSDVTTYYGLQRSLKDKVSSEEFAQTNAYNTRSVNMAGKMPVGPISNPSKESIEASVYPTKNDYYFFVADKHRKIYYSKNQVEHDRTIARLKESGDWLW